MSEAMGQASMNNRVVRVFISSTFKDMDAERNELVRQVFPKLRTLCEGRGIMWTDVDLRWGITEEQVDEGKVLPIILKEINRCRPFFIGLLAERYGWMPNASDIPDELLAEQPWLARRLKHSITELEILHGVLNNPRMAGRSFFYIRDPAYSCGRGADYQAENEVARRRQEKLKWRLRKEAESGTIVLREPYSDAQSLAGMVLSDLTKAINLEFPPEIERDPLDAETAEHDSFAASRTRAYIGRVQLFARLDEHAAGNEQPLVVLGGVGVGKSALLANWGLQRRRLHPDQHVILHFIGASNYSADWVALVKRIMGELKRRFDLDEDIPAKPSELRATFISWLHMAAARGRLILVIDALNQLEERDDAFDLGWLPPTIPPNIRLIVSTTPGRCAEIINKREWSTLLVEPLTFAERRQFIATYLGTYARTLSEEHLSRIASRDQCANPLYLQVLLDELRVKGKHVELDRQIKEFLSAESILQLFDKILGRYEADYQRNRPDLVRDAMRLIWASRSGLSESELLDLLGREGHQMPIAHWSPLYFAAGRLLLSRSGLISFSHHYFRQAVLRRYFTTPQSRECCHLRLADYYEARDWGDRKCREFPWQLAKAQQWQRLSDLLKELPTLSLLWGFSKYDVMSYWTTIERCSPFSIRDVYRDAIDARPRYGEDGWALSELLSTTGHLDIAEQVHEQLAAQYRDSHDISNLVRVLGEQACDAFSRGRYQQSQTISLEQLKLCASLSDLKGMAQCHGNLGNAYMHLGQYIEALKHYKKQGDICGALGNCKGLAASVGNQGNVYKQLGNPSLALEAYQKAMELYRLSGDRVGVSISQDNQASIRASQGNRKAAIEELRTSEAFYRDHHLIQLLMCNLTMQAEILEADGRGNEAAAIRALAELEAVRLTRSPEGLKATALSGGSIGSIVGTGKEALTASHARELQIELLQKELEDAPRSPELHFKLGLLRHDAKQLEAAVSMYRTTLEMRPDWTEVKIRLAEALLQLEEHERS